MSINLESNEINLNPTDTKESYDSGQKIYNFLEKTEFLEKRKDDEKFEEWFQDLSYEDFESYLTRINGILREAKKSERKIVDNVEVTQFGCAQHTPPLEEDKKGFLKETFENLKKLESNSDRALLSFYAIQFIHPYKDGNGRTGRLIYEIFSNKTPDKKRLSQLLNHETKESNTEGKGRYILGEEIESAQAIQRENRYLIFKKHFGKDFTHRPRICFSLKDHTYFSGKENHMDYASKLELEKLPQKDYRILSNALKTLDADWGYGQTALLKAIQENGMLKQFVKKENVIIDNENWTEVKIKIDKLLSNLKSSDFHKIIEEYKKVEIENHKFMNDIFLNPQNYVVKNSKGETIPKKNLLLKPKRREVIQAQESKTV